MSQICRSLNTYDLQPFGKAWSSTLFKAGFVNFFRKVVRVRKTRMMKRGSMLVTDRPIRVMLLSISAGLHSTMSDSVDRKVETHQPSSTVRTGSTGFSALPSVFFSSPFTAGVFSESFAGVLDIPEVDITKTRFQQAKTMNHLSTRKLRFSTSTFLLPLMQDVHNLIDRCASYTNLVPLRYDVHALPYHSMLLDTCHTLPPPCANPKAYSSPVIFCPVFSCIMLTKASTPSEA